MDLAELKNFLAVVRSGSFTGAASTLNVTQPALSRQVQRLERELGVTLLERTPGRLGLTPAGERFRKFAEKALAEFESLGRELRSGAGGISGELRIAASTTPGEFLLPDLLGKFTRLHPGVRPQVTISDSEHVLVELQNGGAEIGFVGAKMRRQGVEYEEVAEDEIVLAVPAGHPIARKKQVRPQDLAGQKFLDRELGSGTLQSVKRILAEHGVPEPPFRVAMVLSSIQAILQAVERGHGVGWVSSMALGPSWEGRVAPVRLTGIPLRRRPYLVHDRRRRLSPQAGAFRALVLDDRAMRSS